MHVDELMPSKWIKASDLKGRAHEVVISDIKVEELGKDKDKKPVMYFIGKQKGMVLNKTKLKVIAGLHGSETKSWTGKAISIMPGKTMNMSGELVDCINVGASLNAKPEPAQQAPVQQSAHDDADIDEDMDDEIPF